MAGESVWAALSGCAFSVGYRQVGPWRTRVLEAGAGETVVLLPGTGGHLEAYARNVAALAGAGFRVLAYDYPGHGYTTLAGADLELPDYLAHLGGLLQECGAGRAHLCGESLGGWIAAKYAAACPDRVGRLVLNTPGGTMSAPEVMSKIRELSQQAADDPTPQRIRARLEWLMADPASVTAELVDIRRAIYAQPGFAASMRHILCLQDPAVRARNLITDAELRAIKAPALVIWTSDDPSGPAAAGLAMADTIPRGAFHLIQDAGHWPQWEQPRHFNDTITRFLTQTNDQ